MTRKPINLELSGGKSRRQRIWNLIRNTNGKPFDIAEVTYMDAHICQAFNQ